MEVLVSWSRRVMAADMAATRARIRARFSIPSITVNLTSRFTVTEADIDHLRAVEALGHFRVLSLTDS